MTRGMTLHCTDGGTGGPPSTGLLMRHAFSRRSERRPRPRMVIDEATEPAATSLPDDMPGQAQAQALSAGPVGEGAGAGDRAAAGGGGFVRNAVTRMSGRRMAWKDSAAARALREEMAQRCVK
jgi:hypothetical protein